MPVMNGIDVLRDIHNNVDPSIRSIPVIMITGVVEKSRVMSILQMEIFDYIVKPVNEDELIEKVHRALSQHNSSTGEMHE